MLKRLGIGVDPEQFGQMSLSPTTEKTDSERARRLVSRRVDWLESGVGTDLIGLLRVLVMQNELVLYALKRLEEAGSARLRPFNPADWK